MWWKKRLGTSTTKQFWHGMNILRSEGHEIYGMHLNKVSLSSFDTKRWIADDGAHKLAYGHKDIKGGGGEGKIHLPAVIVCSRNTVRPRTMSVIGAVWS